MTEADRSILLGMLLGDGCLTSWNRSLRIYHSIKQKDYLEYKKSLVEKILQKTINTCECIHKHYTGKEYYTCGFSVSHPFFKSEYDSIYVNGKKKISRDLLNKLNPQAIAIWIMDDGSTGCRIHKERGKTQPSSIYIDLATYCSKEDAEIIKNYFIEIWDIEPKLRNTGKDKSDNVKWNINFNTKASKKLHSLIKDYIIPTMQYKIRYASQGV